MELQGFNEPWRVHDLRRTVSTEMSRLRINETVAERVINHGPKGLTKVYDKYQFLDEKREALDTWVQKVIDLIAPPPKNVISIQRRGASGSS